jgi:hypothetical protein
LQMGLPCMRLKFCVWLPTCESCKGKSKLKRLVDVGMNSPAARSTARFHQRETSNRQQVNAGERQAARPWPCDCSLTHPPCRRTRATAAGPAATSAAWCGRPLPSGRHAAGAGGTAFEGVGNVVREWVCGEVKKQSAQRLESGEGQPLDSSTN